MSKFLIVIVYAGHYTFLVFIIIIYATSDIAQDNMLLLVIKVDNDLISPKTPFIVRKRSDKSLIIYNYWLFL